MTKGQMIEETAIQFERALPADVDKLWMFLTQPERLAEWHGEAVIEPREGGKVELTGGHIRGVVTGWRPKQFLAHTWNVFKPGEPVSQWPITYLEFALAPAGADSRLVLTHRPIPKAMQPQTAMGWHTFFDMLETVLCGEKIEPRDSYMQKNATIYGVDLDNLKRQ